MVDLAFRLVVAPEAADDIAAALMENAQASRTEPGVERFDVMRSRTDSTVFLVIETYVDDDAFVAHKATPHYAAWKAASADRIVSSERFESSDPAADG